MKIKISVEGLDVLQELQELLNSEQLELIGETVEQLARNNARNKIGGPFGERLARSVEFRPGGDAVEIFADGPDGYIGVHVEEGGPIRSHNGKPLAIPLPNESTQRYNPKRLFARELKGVVPLFKLRSRNGNELLFRQPGKGGELEAPLFVLKDATAPQAPRPWWPTGNEISAAVDQIIDAF